MSDNKILVGDMNRKQCLEILKRLLEAMEVFDCISPSPERINALKMAIASLETDEAYQLEYEQPEFCEDCISREAVEKITWEEPTYTDALNVLTEVRDKIRELPSVLPKADNSILEDIKAEIENMLPNGGVVHKKTVIGIIDNYNADTDKKTKATTKNDLGVIDRKKLIDWINIWDITPIIKNPLIRHIQGMSSVTPIRPKGHWIPYLKEGLIVKCSECKSRYTLGYNYCPNCGADMREVVEE